MKILWLTHPEGDYSEYLILAGMVETVGVEFITLCPNREDMNGKGFLRVEDSGEIVKWATNTYPYEHHFKRSFTGYTACPEWWPRHWKFPHKDRLQDINPEDYDLIVLANTRMVVQQMMNYLRKKFGSNSVGGTRLGRAVSLDGEDYPDIRWELLKEWQPDLHLKTGHDPTYVGVCDGYAHKGVCPDRVVNGVHAFPFSAPPTRVWPHQISVGSQFDVNLQMGWTSSVRKPLVDALCNCEDLNCQTAPANNSIRGTSSSVTTNASHGGWYQWVTELGSCASAVSLRGHGRTTLRNFEIPISPTTLMFLDPPCADIKPAFEDGIHAVYIDPTNIPKTVEIIRETLRDRDRCLHIAQAAHDLVKKHHTCVQRAEAILKWYSSGIWEG
ncbi:MAG: hypothetical protein UY48_C0003G0096 [Candidatus Gottesmanbacteria bacterium GW2011_GWB1_49_7]|uniref:Spore protein YkvP/CgeB glycosyl transferase-like domain-containing protein n=1 Tax=Candidatus Gottesmanbacteria bacterium GW2011_GWB1_49_7 TaxID=1618448 RepID=A0A0G1Z3B9_9BACT|nr:MAG: hypothetical protein UY48_C0003G0096 [Candidatus Gottesmanbacteria bacterium GW2011_GWB1_49_7]